MSKTFIALFMLLSAFALNANGAELIVPDAHKTIQAAVAAAKSGDTVIIKDGDYAENVVIDKPLTLRSEKGVEKTVVKAASKGEAAVTVKDTSAVVIEGISARGSQAAGIKVVNSSNVTLRNNVLTENGYGIALYQSRECTIAGNTANMNESYGIYLEYSDGNRLDSNLANMNSDKGIFMSYAHKNTLVNNTANLNTWNGIVLWSSNDNVLENNRTLRNTYGLVLSDSNNNELNGNTSLPNVFIILPIVIVYLGILSYLIQKSIFRMMHRS